MPIVVTVQTTPQQISPEAEAEQLAEVVKTIQRLEAMDPGLLKDWTTPLPFSVKTFARWIAHERYDLALRALRVLGLTEVVLLRFAKEIACGNGDQPGAPQATPP